ncbi:hypothetical protein MD484_g7660, partial [Candolleomyces efflorescens]
MSARFRGDGVSAPQSGQTLGKETGESDSDATCVATEKEWSDAKAGTARNGKRHTSFLVPQAEHPDKAEPLLLDIQSSEGTDPAPATEKAAEVMVRLGESQLPVELGAAVRGDEDGGLGWQEQATKLNAELSEAKAESARVILALQQQLEVAERRFQRERHEVWSLRAEVGMKDLYIRAMQERTGWAEVTIAQLGERIVENEAQEGRKDLQIRRLTKKIEHVQSSFESMEAALGEKDAELAIIQSVLDQQEAMERINDKSQGTVALLKEMVAKKDDDIDQLHARIAGQELESRRKDRHIRSLSATKQQLEGLCSSLEQTITRNDTTIEHLKHRLSKTMTEVRMKESRIQALSDARTYPPGSTPSKAESQKTISKYENQIAVLKDRLAECLECLRLALEASPGRLPEQLVHYCANYPRESEVDPGALKHSYPIYGTA